MSSGAKHEAIGRKVMVAGIAIGAVAAWGYGVDECLVVCVLGGMWAGFELVTPDADFGRVTLSEARWFRDPRKDSLGSFLAAIVLYQIGLLVLALGFWPGLLLSHRRISHVPIVGAVVIAVLALASPLVLGLLTVTGWWKLWTVGGIVSTWAGFAFAHFVHIFTDKLSKGVHF